MTKTRIWMPLFKRWKTTRPVSLQGRTLSCHRETSCWNSRVKNLSICPRRKKHHFLQWRRITHISLQSSCTNSRQMSLKKKKSLDQNLITDQLIHTPSKTTLRCSRTRQPNKGCKYSSRPMRERKPIWAHLKLVQIRTHTSRTFSIIRIQS